MTNLIKYSAEIFALSHDLKLMTEIRQQLRRGFMLIFNRKLRSLRGSAVVGCLAIAGCDGDRTTYAGKAVDLGNRAYIKSNHAFSCVHQTIPEPEAQPDVLFKYARWLQKNNQLKQDKAIDFEIERLYRIAAKHGHYKANINLENGTRKGFFKLKDHESIRLSQDLIDTGVATGYYSIGIFLQNGSAGLKEDQEMALRYFRKAADLGSGEAQDYVGKKLIQIAKTRELGWQMRRCAAEQGVGKAALALGVHLSGKKEFDSALYAYQLGVAAGNENSASFLRKGFLKQSSSNEVLYLGNLRTSPHM